MDVLFWLQPTDFVFQLMFFGVSTPNVQCTLYSLRLTDIWLHTFLVCGFNSHLAVLSLINNAVKFLLSPNFHEITNNKVAYRAGAQLFPKTVD